MFLSRFTTGVRRPTSHVMITQQIPIRSGDLLMGAGHYVVCSVAGTPASPRVEQNAFGALASRIRFGADPLRPWRPLREAPVFRLSAIN